MKNGFNSLNIFHRTVNSFALRCRQPTRRFVKGHRADSVLRNHKIDRSRGSKKKRLPVWMQNHRNQGIIVITATGCVIIWISSRQEIPYTHRMHSILLGVDTERLIGEHTFNQIIYEAKVTGKLLPTFHPLTQAVRRIGVSIAEVASDTYGGGYQEQMKGIKWEFAVIHSPEMNAFVVPGGKVVVFSGLMDLVGRYLFLVSLLNSYNNQVDSEDELAAVLAHEIAHVLARHAAERITQGSFIELVRMVAYYGFGLVQLSGYKSWHV